MNNNYIEKLQNTLKIMNGEVEDENNEVVKKERKLSQREIFELKNKKKNEIKTRLKNKKNK